jgi:hypothetical protein
MAEPKLEACPFCGGDVHQGYVTKHMDRDRTIHCPCCLFTIAETTNPLLYAAWHRRASPPGGQEGVVSRIVGYGKDLLLACDGMCEKAWGLNGRPRRVLSDNPDDYEFFSDRELGDAPSDPGTYEGGCGKPSRRVHNKWCFRECERSVSMERHSASVRNIFTYADAQEPESNE